MGRKLGFPRVVIVEEISEPFRFTYPWRSGDSVLILGEIQNMPGHVAVATRDGKVHWGYDIYNFREAKEEEL